MVPKPDLNIALVDPGFVGGLMKRDKSMVPDTQCIIDLD